MVDIRPKDVAALVLAWKNPSLCPETSRPEAKLGEAKHPGPCRHVRRGVCPPIRAQLQKCPECSGQKPKQQHQLQGVGTRPHSSYRGRGVLDKAQTPYAALLWLEFVTTPEGQKIMDKSDLSTSVFMPGSVHEKATRGRKLSLMAREHYTKMQAYQKKIVKAYGFPRAERRKR